MVAQGRGWIVSPNLIGHGARAGKGRRAASIAKARRGQRVTGVAKARRGQRVAGGGRRVTSLMGAGSETNTNPVNQEFGPHSKGCPTSPLSSSEQEDVRDAGHSAFSEDLSKFRKLKDEVVRNTQSYIRRCSYRYLPHSWPRP